MRSEPRRLGTGLTDPETRPWFLWDEDLCVRELRAILADESHPRWVELAAKVMREARDDQVWFFLTPRRAADRVGPPRVARDGLRFDPPEELLANKLCAILGRSELRDLVDLFCLEQAGHRVLDAVPAARRKDAGRTPGRLAWAIEQVPLVRLPDGLLVPLSLADLRTFRDRLVGALERLSFPADA